MEDWLAFTETFSNYVLRDLPWKPEEVETKDLFVRQWTLLRHCVLYFLKYHEGQHTEERILQAQKDMLEYGRLAEEVGDPPTAFVYGCKRYFLIECACTCKSANH